MKKLYCAILLLAMPSMYGMQKKTKSHKKFNIHNVQQKKNGKKNKVCKIKQEYSKHIEEKSLSNCARCAVLVTFVVGWFSPILLLPYASRHVPINWSAVIEC